MGPHRSIAVSSNRRCSSECASVPISYSVFPSVILSAAKDQCEAMRPRAVLQSSSGSLFSPGGLASRRLRGPMAAAEKYPNGLFCMTNS